MSILEKIEPVDIIAIFSLAAGFILMAFHVDTVIGGLVSLIIGYYFGHKRKIESAEK